MSPLVEVISLLMLVEIDDFVVQIYRMETMKITVKVEYVAAVRINHYYRLLVMVAVEKLIDLMLMMIETDVYELEMVEFYLLD